MGYRPGALIERLSWSDAASLGCACTLHAGCAVRLRSIVFDGLVKVSKEGRMGYLESRNSQCQRDT